MARRNSEENTQLAEEGQEAIVVGHVYREKNGGGLEVIPFFVDFAAAQVRFAPVGRATEDLMRTSDFLGRFEYLGPVASVAEEQKERPAKKEDTERA